MLFKKLQLKNQDKICVLNAPEEFAPFFTELETRYPDVAVDTSIKADSNGFVLAFVQTEKDIEKIMKDTADTFSEDPLLWFAFPKTNSRRYDAKINQDSDVWQHLSDAGFEGVRQVAIDGDWMALRFRQTDFIKKSVPNPKKARSWDGKKRYI